MKEELLIHNQYKESTKRFKEFDIHLKRIKKLPFFYESSLAVEPNFDISGIYLITGGRQVGKTTFLKQFILSLLEKKKIKPDNILFITGEIIDTHHILRRIIQDFNVENEFQYLFIDEVNYISDWDKTIKYLADAGVFEKMSVILTGSDSEILRTAMKRFAGRRGKADKVDFIFNPLSFKEFVLLKNKKLKVLCEQISKTSIKEPLKEYEKKHDILMSYFKEYLLHGGYLPAISEYIIEGAISKSVFNTYNEWIIGDILKHNKNENYLYEILDAIIKMYGSQISWNSISKRLSIDHHKTVSDYCYLLEKIHVLSIIEALDENRLSGAPKKNRKLYFKDPFIYHSVKNYIDQKFSCKDIADKLIQPDFIGLLAENIAVSHCSRADKVYYIKGSKGEVDIALIQNKGFLPIEVKWTKQFRKEELKQISLYKNGIILTANAETRKYDQSYIVPLLRFLIYIS